MLEKIKQSDLLPPVDWVSIIDSSKVGVVKPQREIYELAQKRAGVPGNQILFVDNKAENLEAPKNLGWQTFYYDSADHEKSSKNLLEFIEKLMDPNLITIRPYNPIDYPGMVGVLKDAGIYDEATDTERVYRNKIETNPQSMLVAIKNGEVIGCATAVTEWGPLVFRLAVKKAHRDRGLGTTPLTEVEEYLRKQYHTEVHILVDERERDLKKWYEKRGYKPGTVYRWYSKKI